MSLKDLQKQLGHKSLATTEKYLADTELEDPEMARIVEAASYRAPRPRLAVVA